MAYHNVGEHQELHMVGSGFTYDRKTGKWVKIESHLATLQIVCKCGHETCRDNCKQISGENEHMTIIDYYCDSCSEWIRTDSKAKPLPEKVKKTKETEDNEDSDDE